MILQNRAITVSENDGLPLPKRYWAILATALGVGMSVIDGTIANVALPTIARDLGTSPSVTIWVVNAYQLAITISLLSFASLGDIYGYRRIYLSGILLFSITSAICALADSFWMLTTARILQGFGAAAITSVNTALLRIIYPKRFLGRGMGINALVVAVSIAAGPTIASVILSLGSWHWLFAINIPIGIAALVIGLMHLPANPVKVTGRRFDKLSCLMNALTFGLLIFSLEGIAHKENTTLIIAGIATLFMIGYFFVRHQRTNAGNDFPPLFPSGCIGTKRRNDRPASYSLAVGNDDHGPACRTVSRTDSCRYTGRYRYDDICYRSFPTGHITR